MNLAKKIVVEYWRNGLYGQTPSKSLWTDGRDLYSYFLKIGYKINGKRVVRLYTSPFKFVSRTTSSHVSAALAHADLVENPLTGEVRPYYYTKLFNMPSHINTGEWIAFPDARYKVFWPVSVLLRKCINSGVPCEATYLGGFFLQHVTVPEKIAKALSLLYEARFATRVERRILREVVAENWPEELKVLQTMRALAG